jgi:hypothetical protein
MQMYIETPLKLNDYQWTSYYHETSMLMNQSRLNPYGAIISYSDGELDPYPRLIIFKSHTTDTEITKHHGVK